MSEFKNTDSLVFSVHFCQTWHPGQSTPIESLATVLSSSIVTTHALGAECCVPSESFPACEHLRVLLMSVSRETWCDRSACSRLARGWLAFLITAAGTGHSPAFSASLVAMCCAGKSADLGVHLSWKVAVLGLLLLLWNSWRRLFALPVSHTWQGAWTPVRSQQSRLRLPLPACSAACWWSIHDRTHFWKLLTASPGSVEIVLYICLMIILILISFLGKEDGRLKKMGGGRA